MTTKKVAIVGGPGTGKTVLARAVANALSLKGFNADYAVEFARDYIKKYGKPKSVGEQLLILMGQIEREDSLSHCDFAVFDSSAFLPYIYAHLLEPSRAGYSLPSSLLQESYLQEHRKYIAALLKLHEEAQFRIPAYSFIFFIPKEFPFKQDKLRIQTSDEEAEKISKMILGFLESELVPFHMARGSPEERLAKVLKALKDSRVI